jgi:hypothetical protein
MQEFFINKDSELPILEMRLVNDGRHPVDENFFYNLQDADITFTMTDIETGVVKVARQKGCLIPNSDCNGTFNIAYRWQKRDTARPGKYAAHFDIIFSGNMDVSLENRKLTVPVMEPLTVNVISPLIHKNI